MIKIGHVNNVCLYGDIADIKQDLLSLHFVLVSPNLHFTLRHFKRDPAM